MGMSWAWRGVLLYLALFLIHFPFVLPLFYCSLFDIQNLYKLDTVQFGDGSTVRILCEGEPSSQGPGFACGFFCNQSSDRCPLSIFILFYKSYEIQNTVGPQVVWSANQTNPVSINATVRLSPDGGLMVQEADGTIVWTTNIYSENRPILNLTNTGNLQLLGDNGSTVWQSFDHPSDLLLLGQKLSVGQKLTSAASATYQIERGLFSLSLDIDGLFAFRQSNEGPERYYHHDSFSTSYVQFMNGSLSFFTVDKLFGPYKDFLIPSALSSWQYMRFESDRHLRVYEWKQQSLEWKEVADLLTADIGNCGYPTVCDGYSICTNGKCSCLEPKNDRRYFKQINDSQPGRGCSLVTPLSCEASLNQNFLELKNITSVTFRQDLEVDSESCKEACLKNCLCKAAIFQKYTWGSFVGFCYLPSQNFSLKHAEVNDSYISTTYIKEKLQKKQLLDLVDKYSEDMQLHGAEVVDMMKVAAWCLQSDFTKRPSMSVVVKVLEGVVDVEENIEYNFCNPPISNPRARVMYHEVNVGNATALLDSVLSGPR
ncbi:ep1-like glycoprotein 4 [Quercus suber]|uniref:Ep1-like glycoprotein 4 n=1 Tax=Quercus suber TaxID=58331 RepID=A0AAW0LP73_QUESU